MNQNNTVYFLEGKMYINVTNLCTSACRFCIRDVSEGVKGTCLKLSSEITIEKIIDDIKNAEPKFKAENINDVVFCGWGEPLIRLDLVIETSKYIRQKYPQFKIRINTNGHGNLIHKKNIVLELKGLIDSVSVSLNAENETLYNELCQPKIEGAYDGMKEFIKECSNAGITTFASVVQGYKEYEIDIEKCKKIAKELGAELRVREWLDEGYN